MRQSRSRLRTGAFSACCETPWRGPPGERSASTATTGVRCISASATPFARKSSSLAARARRCFTHLRSDGTAYHVPDARGARPWEREQRDANRARNVVDRNARPNRVALAGLTALDRGAGRLLCERRKRRRPPEARLRHAAARHAGLGGTARGLRGGLPGRSAVRRVQRESMRDPLSRATPLCPNTAAAE